ncbi:MAG TPA: thiamine pyrophosphate-dependent dehydrogenase E1 component subunit alpha [Candidatus Dormibacteraeota bacterium]|jgi:2-oxoisovalerate dehydrogenase E1 component alpha subunit|nr:thiamine pyrophosphate-dependent dehydrogenase E1 component subunit alpha [Candidatus Dormibacteraeota bacterium]
MSEEGKAPAFTAPRARHSALGLEPERLLTMYRQMLLARALDQRAWTLNRQGKAPFVISCQGHEAAQVAAAAALRPGVDWVVPYYRDLALCLALGMTAREFMLSVLARADDPGSGGRQMPAHFSLRRARVVTVSSTVATQVVHAAGIAYASRLRGLDEVTLTTLGEGSTSRGDWHEALNFAGVHRLPLICLVEDNGYAISVPRRLQMPVVSVAERARGYGMAGVDVDGGDPLAVYEAMGGAVRRARAGEGPTLIRARCGRITSHSSDDDQRRYRPPEELEEVLRSDPIDRFRAYLREEALLTEEDEERLRRECLAEVEAAVEAAEAAPPPDPADLERHVYAAGG